MNRIIFPVFIFLFFLQYSFFPMLSPIGLNVNLLLALAVVLTKQFGFQQIFPWLFLMGVVYDYFSVQVLGVGVATFLSIGFFIEFVLRKISISEKNIVFNVFFYVFIKVIFDILVILVEKIFIVLGIAEISEINFKIMSINYLWEIIGFVVVCLILSKFFGKIKNSNLTNLKLEN